jgi:nitroreductase
LTNSQKSLELSESGSVPTRRSILRRAIATAAVLPALAISSAAGAELPPFAEAKGAFKLPNPQVSGGMPLMEALKARRSTREFSDRPLPTQVLSDLLWAAWGVNRSEEGLRTAPSTHGKSSIDIYLAMTNGVWRYDPAVHALVPHLGEDIREATTTGQPFAKTVPLNLIYVSNGARVGAVPDAERQIYILADAAAIGQNVYLFCASQGLGTVIRGSVDGPKVVQRLKLSAAERIGLCQSVGYPKA